jgi:hypothetical protein
VGVLLLFYPPKLPPILTWKTLEKSHRFQWDEGEAGGAGEALSSALCTAQRLQQFAAPPDDRSETTGREGCIKTIYLSIHPSNLISSNPTQSNPNQSVYLCFHPSIFPYNMANLTFQIEKHFIYLEVPVIDHFHRHSCVGLPRNFSHLPPHTGFQVLQSCPVETADAVQFDFGIRTMENQ